MSTVEQSCGLTVGQNGGLRSLLGVVSVAAAIRAPVETAGTWRAGPQVPAVNDARNICLIVTTSYARGQLLLRSRPRNRPPPPRRGPWRPRLRWDCHWSPPRG